MYVDIYMILTVLALLVAPYIYDISRVRVNAFGRSDPSSRAVINSVHLTALESVYILVYPAVIISFLQQFPIFCSSLFWMLI